MDSVADRVAGWAAATVPTPAELDLADDALLDTLSVIHAAARADDVHLPSTSHISAVCLPVALASAGASPPQGIARGTTQVKAHMADDGLRGAPAMGSPRGRAAP
jgi:hypothetical protein